MEAPQFISFQVSEEESLFVSEAVKKIGQNDFWFENNTGHREIIIIPEIVTIDEVVKVWDSYFPHAGAPCVILHVILNIFNPEFVEWYDAYTKEQEQNDDELQDICYEQECRERMQNEIKDQIKVLYNALCKLQYPAKIQIGKTEVEVGEWLRDLVGTKGKKLIHNFKKEKLGGRPSSYAYRMAGKISSLICDKKFWSKAEISLKTTGKGNRTNEFIAEILAVAGYCEKTDFEDGATPYCRVSDAKKAWKDKEAFHGQWRQNSLEEMPYFGLSDEEFLKILFS